MLKKTFKYLLKSAMPGLAQRLYFRRIYDRIADETSSRRLAFMNYGFAPIGDPACLFELRPEDEPFRLNIQLYSETVAGVDIEGRQVLEVGSGRGGGSYFLKAYLNAASVVGVDLSPQAVKVSSRTYTLEALAFRCGNAEALPFQSSSFDVVVNVESSHCYPDCSRFFHEVHRVLRPGGWFCYSDFGTDARMRDMQQAICTTGFEMMRSTDITANVLRSLSDGTAERAAFFRSITGADEKRYRYLAHTWRLAGTPGYEAFQTRSEVYWSSLFRKKVTTGETDG